jgi:1-phosphatidylinositol-4-phosphate 5-kinase
MRAHPDTLLPWFLGMYRIKAKGATSKSDHTIRVVVMANVFDGASETTPISEQFDLKGSTHARTNNNGGCGPAKDLDWKTGKRRMVLEPGMHSNLEDQLNIDVKFLQRMNIMDYSLLVGISDDASPGKGHSISPISISKKSPSSFFPSFATFFKPEPTPPKTQESAASPRKICGSRFRQHFGGIKPAACENKSVYWCGIIDILQPFNLKKRIEMKVKGKVTAGGKDAVSCADPNFYGQRFLGFVLSDVVISSETPPPLPPKFKSSRCSSSNNCG